MEIKGRGVLITGAAKRIGRAIALGLARRGANVVINYNQSREAAGQTVAELEACGVRAFAIQADVAKVVEVERMVKQAAEFLGRLDVVINNASVFYRAPLDSVTEADWDINLDVNLKGSFFCAKFAAELMLTQGGGKIINIADWAGFRPYVNYLPYSIAKAGVIALTQTLAKALAPTIQVNAVAPGTVLLAEEYDDDDKQKIIQGTPLRRIGSPEDVVQAVVYLIEGGDFMTGHTLVVDGGRLIS